MAVEVLLAQGGETTVRLNQVFWDKGSEDKPAEVAPDITEKPADDLVVEDSQM